VLQKSFLILFFKKNSLEKKLDEGLMNKPHHLSVMMIRGFLILLLSTIEFCSHRKFTIVLSYK
jgi:hypothetical protein